MAQLVVRNLEDEVKVGLQRRARLHGRSTEEEVRVILRNALKDELPSQVGLGTQLAAIFAGIGLEEDLEPLPKQEARPADFGS